MQFLLIYIGKLQVSDLQQKNGDLELELSEIRRSLEISRAESRAVKEESTQHLTRMHELKEANEQLAADLQDSIDQSQDLKARVLELGKNCSFL